MPQSEPLYGTHLLGNKWVSFDGVENLPPKSPCEQASATAHVIATASSVKIRAIATNPAVRFGGFQVDPVIPGSCSYGRDIRPWYRNR